MKMLDETRLRNPALMDKIVSPEKAAELITDGMNVGVAGFTPSGYPKKTTLALAEAIKRGKKCRINLWSGASVGPEIEEALAAVDGVASRMPYYAASNNYASGGSDRWVKVATVPSTDGSYRFKAGSLPKASFIKFAVITSNTALNRWWK